ncbi:hypothetical protein [Thalassoroseus pseudoceratinae]|uniref:hypothetical protein n=1 Tax=Thalassoroseus pseudoceratinae TaxID=2713176 RepID=UPI0014208009|nr:hypothetical protein [Thalassoroseus pseudoceratinae]
MSISKEAAIRHLDSVLIDFENINRFSDFGRDCTDDERHACVVRMKAAIRRLAPSDSEYLSSMMDTSITPEWGDVYQLAGIVQALRADFAEDCLDSFRELVNAELYDDFLGMAEFLLHEQSLKQPAAVIAGSVLEEHLRKLSLKNGVDIEAKKNGKSEPLKASRLNADLRKASVYNQNEMKQVEAWLAIRNSAAHGKYEEFDESQVEVMLLGIRGFLSRYPA